MMDLDAIANLASILTAIVATGAACIYWIDKHRKRIRLEKYLKKKKDEKAPEYVHTVLHLMAELGMTEAEVLHASFVSRCIVRGTYDDPKTNLATQLLFQYSDGTEPEACDTGHCTAQGSE